MDIQEGGLDIFFKNQFSDGTFKDVQNIGADINSPKDDLPNQCNLKLVLFGSNRNGGFGL
jgi:hypothetical protein